MVSRRRSARPAARTRTPSRTRSGRSRSGRGYRPYRTVRRRRGTATTFGGAFGLLLVYAVLRGGWSVRIGVLLVGVLLVAGYVWLTRRDAAPEPAPDAGQEPAAEPAQTAAPAGPDPQETP